VSLQNIRGELEETEIEAWRKLIRVLTHEIMNSITPISSLASTVNDLVRRPPSATEGTGSSEPETRIDVIQALETIQKRSEGLLHFVDAYRNLTLIPRPKFRLIRLDELLGRVRRLMDASIREHGIGFEIRVEPETLEIAADPELLEQVLINLLVNARQAVEGRPGARIAVTARLDARGRVLIQVTDNGPGIAPENLEQIFVPFFSTKENGSGIGLSLSRQIMRLHDGTISVHSKPGEDTVFTLRF
jgi:signal transduction histidine kinase